MPNVLEMQIVGDISGLEKALKQAEILQFDYTKAIEKTSSELKESINVTNGYKKAIDDLNNEFKSGSVSAKDYSKNLANLKRDEKESTIATSELRKELSNLKREQKEVGSASLSTTTGLNKLNKSAANGTSTVTELSRVFQDAPYGIQGAANNVQQLVGQFGYLQKSAGGTVGALKAIGSSLIGSGGILLAVSLVTSALTYMSQNNLSVGDVLDQLSGNFDNVKKSIQDVNNEAIKSSGAEIATMEALVAVAKNDVNTREERNAAVAKLQEEYPAHFGNLTKEQILNGDVEAAVKAVTFALIQKAKAQTLATKIAENDLKILQKQQEGQKLFADYTAGKGSFAILKGATAQQFLKASADSTASSIDSLNKEQKALTKELENSTKAATAFDAANSKAKADQKPGKVAKVDLTPKVEAVPTFVFDPNKTEKELRKGLELLRENFGDAEKDFKNNPIKLNIPLQAVTTGSEFEDYRKKLEQAKADTQIFADGVGASVGALGNELASSLATGNAALDAFVGSVIQGLAQVAAAQLAGLIAKQTVAAKDVGISAGVSTANAIEGATATAAATGPAAAFVLPALVGAAIGFIAASFAGIKFAHGGIVPGGSFTGDKIPAMLNSGEAVMNQQQQANTLMAIANGNSNSLQGNRKSSTFVLETKLRGSDLLLAIKREEKSR